METNKTTLTATQLISRIWQENLARGLPQGSNLFDEYIERVLTDTWLFHTNSIRFTAAMAGGGEAATPGSPAPGSPATPPPLPQQATFFIAVNNQQTGPFDLPTLRQKVQSGEVQRETLAWKQGMATWTPAGQVPELQSLFGPTPPPLPPQE